MNGFVKLLVNDLPQALAFYQALGFELEARVETIAHLIWREDVHVYLVAVPPGARLEGARGIGVLVCFVGDVDYVAAQAKAAGASVDGPREEPWGAREIVVVDPDGYRLAFSEPVVSSGS